MTDCNTPFIPPSIVGSVVASSPLQYPLHPPSQTHPHTPKGYAHALRGDARPVEVSDLSSDGVSMVPMPRFMDGPLVAVLGYSFALNGLGVVK